jgi:peptide/nickel transport system substrate-binding protein
VRQNPDRQTLNGFTETVLGGARVLQLEWSPNSPMRSDKALRQAIAVACKETARPIPLFRPVSRDTRAAFPLGGKAKPKVTWKSRINLTLGYDATMPNGQDLAAQIRQRLENTGGSASSSGQAI